MRMLLMNFDGGWGLLSAIILFVSSLYGFLTSEIAAEVEIIAEVGEELLEDGAEMVGDLPAE
jgi:hypothetical protein